MWLDARSSLYADLFLSLYLAQDCTNEASAVCWWLKRRRRTFPSDSSRVCHETDNASRCKSFRRRTSAKSFCALLSSSVLLLAKTITHPAARSLCDSWASCSWMSIDGHGTNWRRNIYENFNRQSRVHERYRQTDDRQTTDRRQTDGRRHIANVDVR